MHTQHSTNNTTQHIADAHGLHRGGRPVRSGEASALLTLSLLPVPLALLSPFPCALCPPLPDDDAPPETRLARFPKKKKKHQSRCPDPRSPIHPPPRAANPRPLWNTVCRFSAHRSRPWVPRSSTSPQTLIHAINHHTGHHTHMHSQPVITRSRLSASLVRCSRPWVPRSSTSSSARPPASQTFAPHSPVEISLSVSMIRELQALFKPLNPQTLDGLARKKNLIFPHTHTLIHNSLTHTSQWSVSYSA